MSTIKSFIILRFFSILCQYYWHEEYHGHAKDFIMYMGFYRKQCGRAVRVLDLQVGGPEFESCPDRGPTRVNCDKRHGPKSSDSA